MHIGCKQQVLISFSTGIKRCI